jgi:hypothetical protein
MAKFMGRLGAVYAPVGTTDFAGVSLTPVGGASEYVVSDVATRVARAFAEDAAVSDFTPSSGTVMGLTKPVGAVTISGGTPPYTLSSANGKVLALASVGGFLNWSLNVEQEIVDVTTLGAEYRERQRLNGGWEAEADRFWVDENFTLDATPGKVAMGGRFVVSFFVNTEASRVYRYVGFASVEGFDVSTPARGIVRATVRFRGDDALYFRRASD